VDKKELKTIAMNDGNHVFRVTKYKDLVKILDALLKESCQQGKFSSFLCCLYSNGGSVVNCQGKAPIF